MTGADLRILCYHHLVDRELAAAIGAALAAGMAFAWRVIKLSVATRHKEVEAQLELARSMQALRDEVHALLQHQRQAVFRPYRAKDSDG